MLQMASSSCSGIKYNTLNTSQTRDLAMPNTHSDNMVLMELLATS